MRISDWSSDVCSSDLGSRLVIKVGSKCDGKISKNDAAARPISHHCMPLGEAGNAVQQGPVIDEARHALTYIQRIKGKQVGMANRLAQHKGMKGCKARERSEEHTSELQSLMRISYAVFCLNKKKT